MRNKYKLYNLAAFVLLAALIGLSLKMAGAASRRSNGNYEAGPPGSGNLILSSEPWVEVVGFDPGRSGSQVSVIAPRPSSGVVVLAGESGQADGTGEPGFENIGELFLLDELFDRKGSLLLNNDSTTIGDLLVLNRLFNGGSFGAAGNGFSINDLFILDRLFKNDPGLDPDETTLGDLFILDSIFNR